MLIWAFAGAFLAAVFAFVQFAGLRRNGAKDPQKMISKSMLHSGIRILLVAALLYFGFSSHIQNGLACLITFLIVRWISLFLLAHKIKT